MVVMTFAVLIILVIVVVMVVGMVLVVWILMTAVVIVLVDHYLEVGILLKRYLLQRILRNIISYVEDCILFEKMIFKSVLLSKISPPPFRHLDSVGTI